MFLHWVNLPLYPKFDMPEYYGFGRKKELEKNPQAMID